MQRPLSTFGKGFTGIDRTDFRDGQAIQYIYNYKLQKIIKFLQQGRKARNYISTKSRCTYLEWEERETIWESSICIILVQEMKLPKKMKPGDYNQLKLHMGNL